MLVKLDKVCPVISTQTIFCADIVIKKIKHYHKKLKLADYGVNRN